VEPGALPDPPSARARIATRRATSSARLPSGAPFRSIFFHPFRFAHPRLRQPRPLSHHEQTIASNPFPGANGSFPYPNPYGVSYAAALAGGKGEAKPAEAAEGKEGAGAAAAVWSAATARGGNAAPQQDERELKRQRRKQSNRESARRSRLRKQAECEELGSRVGGLTEENEKLRGEVKRLLEQCTALSEDNKRLRGSVEAAGGTLDTPAPTMPDGPTEEEKAAAAAAGAAAAAEAMEAAKKAAALAAGDSDDPDEDGSKDAEDDDSK
jgi:plant G-box-binding factor